MRLPCWLPILAFLTLALPGEAQSKDDMSGANASPTGRSHQEKAFAESVRKYVELQQYLQSSVRAQKSTNESEQIAERQQQLRGLMANTRRGAQRGEVFTHEVSEHFQKIIRKAFKGPGSQAIRQTIRERDPVKRIVLKVNAVYPDDEPRTTMSPTLLNRLPVLPKELAYRIIGRDLVLQDTQTNLIVDFILQAIP
jgi:hypothetical protein